MATFYSVSFCKNIRLWILLNISILFYAIGLCQNIHHSLNLQSYSYFSSHPVSLKSSLRGKVVDKNHHPIANIKVTVSELNIHTYTDAEGNYAFCNFSEGRYTIIFDDGKRKKELTPVLMPKKLVYNIEWE